MPIYEYACTECGHHFEQYRKVNARKASRCPECGKPGRKVFRPVGVIFKGSGFHCTDYRTPAAGTSESKRSSQASSPPSSDSDAGGGGG